MTLTHSLIIIFVQARELEIEEKLKLAKEKADITLNVAKEEVSMLNSSITETEDKLKATEKKLEATEGHVLTALKDLVCKEQQLQLNVEMAYMEIIDYKKK